MEKLELIDHSNNITDFQQKLENGVWVWDFNKIATFNFFMTLIISQRGFTGKSFNMKVYAYWRWKKFGERTMWVRNIMKDVTNESKKFLKTIPTEMKGCRVTGNIETGNCWVVDEDGNEFIRMVALGYAEDEKGARAFYHHIVFDEFNVNFRKVKDYVGQLDDLLQSTNDMVLNDGQEDKARLYFFGNNKSLNHPLLIELGVTSLKDDISMYKFNNLNMLMVLSKTVTAKERKEFAKRNNMNQRFMFTKLIGRENHSYFNDNIIDDVNFVYPVFDTLSKEIWSNMLRPLHQFFINGELVLFCERINGYQLKTVDNGNVDYINYHIVAHKSIRNIYKKMNKTFNEEEFTLDYSYINKIKTDSFKENLTLIPKSSLDILIDLTARSSLSFEDIPSRELFFDFIKKN